VVIALSLNFLVRKSVSNPIRNILNGMDRVRRGDFTKRIRVLSNDELGTLGDAANDMIAALMEREQIRDTFGKYVDPEIRDEILSKRIPVNGEKRQATLLFSDIRNFTHYVEQNHPEEVIQSLRDYFSAMQAAIRKHHGVVLQYVGDEVEAVFGIPLAFDDHADRAVLAACEMKKNLEALNRSRIVQGKEPLRHGIGIHTGEVLAGTVGSVDRLSYTLIGDTVNLASRIQDLTKKTRCDILMSEETAKHLHRPFNLKNGGSHRVKGFSKPIGVFQMKG